MKHFSHSYIDERPPSVVREEALLKLVPNMGRSGYSLEAQDQHSLTFVSRYRSDWIYLVCIIFFPLGLLALLVEKRVATLLVSIEAAEGGQTRVIFAGEAFRQLRKSIEQMPSPDGDREGRARKALYYVAIALAALASIWLLGLIWGPLAGVAIWALIGFGGYKLYRKIRPRSDSNQVNPRDPAAE